MKWIGSEPIVIGEVDENGVPVKTVVINPGDDIPPEWEAKMKAAPDGKVHMIGQDDPFDLEGVRRHFAKRRAK